MSNFQDYIDAQHYHHSSQTFETAMFHQPNPLPNLSLTGRLVQHRQRNSSSRQLQRSRGRPPLPRFRRPGAFAQYTPRATQISPSATYTSTSSSSSPPLPPSTPGQLSYHRSNVLYNQMNLRLNLLVTELTEEMRQHRNHTTAPQPRDPLVSIREKHLELAALQGSLDAIAQGVRDLGELEDGVWGYSSSLEEEVYDEDEEEAAAAWSLEVVQGSIVSMLSAEEVNEVVAEAWMDVYPESGLELRRFPGMYL